MLIYFCFLGQNKPSYQQRSPQPRSQTSQSQGSGNFDPPMRERNNRNNLPDFGDRYSANRTKDRQRREQQRLQQQQHSGGQHQQQPSDQQQHQRQQVHLTVYFRFRNINFFFPSKCACINSESLALIQSLT